MSNLINATAADIDKIDTNRIQVNQALTNLRWDARLKHPDFSLLNTGATAKLVSEKSGEKAILANTGYLIGTASESVSYKINQGSVIHVGFAESTRDLGSLIAGDNLVSHQLTVSADTTVYLDLSTTELTVTYNNVIATIDITSYAGKTMHPWVSDDNETNGLSVSIYKTARLSMYIDADGKAVFKTSTSNGVDRPIKFDTGSASLEFTGGQLISDTVHNLIESDNGTPMVLRESGGLDVTIDATGTITADGNVVCIDITASSITSPGITPLVLTSTGADTSLLAVGGDVIVNAGGSGFTVTDTTGAVVFDATATATSFISDSIRSTLGGDLTLYEQTGGGGLIITDTTGNAQFSADLDILGELEVDSIISHAASDLDLTENGGLGLHITTSTGAVTCDSDLNVGADAVIADTASVGPTLVDGGICFAASDGAGSKAMLLPRTTNHAAITPVQAGMIVFNTGDQTLRIYDGSAWQTIAFV